MSHWSKPLTAMLLLIFIAAIFSGYTLRVAKPPETIPDLRVGVSPGPHAEIMEVVKQLAEQNGLKIQIVTYSDYTKLNPALDKGIIDINSFQHRPYLERNLDNQKLEIEPMGKSFIFPIGLYSLSIKTLDAVPSGATVFIPSDLQNMSRALLLLEEAGFIHLKKVSGSFLVQDIVENPKQLHVEALDSQKLANQLSKADLVVLNTHIAVAAGLHPKQALVLEKGDSPYTNIFAIRKNDAKRPLLQQFVELYHSPEVKQFIQEQYKETMLTSW